ncbi:hypothetical protein QVD17_06499 [Tagetes erecta]|uniref:MYB transcription factor n=1 Tax=Tagetes erecta TaxID=13708 RepID=A0AAD8P6I9_TARER|nr:hypothetical protein QVD17_06499 [Tagetes erecta]
MGVPKQKWTSEEEASLKAGITKHGPGKWSTILKDPEFGSVLRLRSNVDLKDKWRNLQSLTSGCGPRQRARSAKSKTQPIHMSENISSAIKEEHDMQICLPDPPTPLAGTLQNDSSKMPMPRLDSLILETVANLKELKGSSRSAIAEYIKEKYSAPPNLEKLLKAELKTLIDSGKLIEVKHRYKIAPSSNQDLKPNSFPLLLEGIQECCPTSTIKILTKAEIDAELEKMWSMTPQQAAAMAMKAVAEAEAAISEAERATREAETAEADAELAKIYAAAAMRALKQTTLCTCGDASRSC